MQIETRGDRIFNVINYTILILVTIIVMYPLVLCSAHRLATRRRF